MSQDNPDPDRVFHSGELAIQERTGARDRVARFGSRMVRPYMPDQHRAFFEMLPFIIVGLVDHRGRPWATLASGEPGFILSSDETTLQVAAQPLLADTLGIAPATGDKIGLLGIELPTRRRNRMNGVITKADARSMTIHVDQSFGNCPQYIQTRTTRWSGEAPAPGSRERTISTAAKAVIERVDTFFIASRTSKLDTDPRHGVDVSHRGGRAGFVHVSGPRTVEFPDFPGNSIFNTLGNIEEDGRIGIMFSDFATGDAVFLTGRAKIIWDQLQVRKFAGAERLVQVKADEIVTASATLPFTGPLVEMWPPLESTGTWDTIRPDR